MKTLLQSLVTIVTKYGSKTPDIIHFGRSRKGEEDMYEKAFNLLLEGIAPDDKTRKSYPGHEKGSPAFRKFESRLVKKMLNMALLTDISDTAMSAALKAELESMKTAYLARLLTALYERDAGMAQAQKVYNDSEEMGLSLSMLAGLALLRKNASETGEEKDLKAYQAQSAKWLERLAAEEKAKMFYEQMEVHFGKSISQKPELADSAFASAALIEKDLKRFDSPVLHFEWRMLRYAGHHCRKAYRDALAEMDALLAYFDSHPEFAGPTRYGLIAINKLNCYMHMPDHVAGQVYAEEGLGYFWLGSRNHLFFMELYYLFAMQTANYEKAGNIIADIENEPGYQDLNDMHKEKWRLHKAYYQYASRTWDPKKKYSAERFFQDYTSLISDKSGYNAAIYIMAWCIQLRYGGGPTSTSAEAMMKYRVRYLSGEQHKRLNIFMQMMQIAERLAYNRSAVIETTAELLKEMKATPVEEFTGNLEGVEILPLERIWENAVGDMQELRI